jgi:hypothetical protein
MEHLRRVYGGKNEDVLLHQSIKDLLQEMIDVLQTEYNKVIASPNCTEYDALEYILLFAIEGNIAATKLGSNMDEYYAAVDIYADLLGLYGDKNDK